MKTYRVIVTPLALEHIQRITDYIADSLHAPDTALRWLDKTEQAIASLETMPLRFMTVEEEPWHSKGIRRMLEGNYFVYYVADEAASAVRVVAVVYARSDQLAMLGEL
jgi:toxin ParE1/3/4